MVARPRPTAPASPTTAPATASTECGSPRAGRLPGARRLGLFFGRVLVQTASPSMNTRTLSSAFPLLLACVAGGALSCATASSPGQGEEATTTNSEPPAQTSDDLAWWRKSMETVDQRL